MNPEKLIRSLWQRLMMRNTAFKNRNSKIRMLYTLQDPWNMSSPKEQARFRKTNQLLASIIPRFKSILELGCGEGHQTKHFSELADHVHGVDISARAIKRAKKQCPTGNFVVSGIGDIKNKFPDIQFDLIVACEVLYYVSDIESFLETYKSMTSRIFVSNYLPRSVSMRHHFTGVGWHQLESIKYEETIWECFLWERETPHT